MSLCFISEHCRRRRNEKIKLSKYEVQCNSSSFLILLMLRRHQIFMMNTPRKLFDHLIYNSELWLVNITSWCDNTELWLVNIYLVCLVLVCVNVEETRHQLTTRVSIRHVFPGRRIVADVEILQLRSNLVNKCQLQWWRSSKIFWLFSIKFNEFNWIYLQILKEFTHEIGGFQSF